MQQMGTTSVAVHRDLDPPRGRLIRRVVSHGVARRSGTPRRFAIKLPSLTVHLQLSFILSRFAEYSKHYWGFVYLSTDNAKLEMQQSVFRDWQVLEPWRHADSYSGKNLSWQEPAAPDEIGIITWNQYGNELDRLAKLVNPEDVKRCGVPLQYGLFCYSESLQSGGDEQAKAQKHFNRNFPGGIGSGHAWKQWFNTSRQGLKDLGENAAKYQEQMKLGRVAMCLYTLHASQDEDYAKTSSSAAKSFCKAVGIDPEKEVDGFATMVESLPNKRTKRAAKPATASGDDSDEDDLGLQALTAQPPAAPRGRTTGNSKDDTTTGGTDKPPSKAKISENQLRAEFTAEHNKLIAALNEVVDVGNNATTRLTTMDGQIATLQTEIQALKGNGSQIEEKDKKIATHSVLATMLIASISGMFETEENGGLAEGHAGRVKGRLFPTVLSLITMMKSAGWTKSDAETYLGPLFQPMPKVKEHFDRLFS